MHFFLIPLFFLTLTNIQTIPPEEVNEKLKKLEEKYQEDRTGCIQEIKSGAWDYVIISIDSFTGDFPWGLLNEVDLRIDELQIKRDNQENWVNQTEFLNHAQAHSVLHPSQNQHKSQIKHNLEIPETIDGQIQAIRNLILNIIKTSLADVHIQIEPSKIEEMLLNLTTIEAQIEASSIQVRKLADPILETITSLKKDINQKKNCFDKLTLRKIFYSFLKYFIIIKVIVSQTRLDYAYFENHKDLEIIYSFAQEITELETMHRFHTKEYVQSICDRNKNKDRKDLFLKIIEKFDLSYYNFKFMSLVFAKECRGNLKWCFFVYC